MPEEFDYRFNDQSAFPKIDDGVLGEGFDPNLVGMAGNGNPNRSFLSLRGINLPTTRPVKPTSQWIRNIIEGSRVRFSDGTPVIADTPPYPYPQNTDEGGGAKMINPIALTELGGSFPSVGSLHHQGTPDDPDAYMVEEARL